jgi:hypothetical protein
MEIVVIDLVIVLGRADREQRRARNFPSTIDGENRLSLAFGQLAPELLDRCFELDDVLVREQSAPRVDVWVGTIR